KVARLAAIKFVRMWNIVPNEDSYRNGWLWLVIPLTYAPLIGCALFGAARYATRSAPLALTVLPAIYLTLIHMVFVSSIRYREPAMAPLTVLAAAVVMRSTPKSLDDSTVDASTSPAS